MRRPSYTWYAICTAAIVSLLLMTRTAPSSPIAAQPVDDPSQPPHIVINEIAWGGTQASAADEWVELLNTSNTTVSLDNWRLVAVDGAPDIPLAGTIAPYGYYLIERTDDTTISNITADLIIGFGYGLSNQGETLHLLDDTGGIVDTVNASGGNWPTDDGGAPYYRAMERRSPITSDTDDAWRSHTGDVGSALDADHHPIHGSPAAINSVFAAQWAQVSDIVVLKTGPDLLAPHGSATYQLTLTNHGGLTATHMQLVDTLPNELQFIAQESPLSFTQMGQTLSWEITDLPPATHIGITMTARLIPSAQPGISINNRLTATTVTTDLCAWNDAATWTTVIETPEAPQPALLLSGVLYDGYQYNDADEAIEITNHGQVDADLSGWSLCREEDGAMRRWALPPVHIPSASTAWLAKESAAFEASFGHRPVAELASWPRLANSGDTLLLCDEQNRIVDALAYGDSALAAPNWLDPSLQPYTSPALRGISGQILSRRLDEGTGLPITDTNTAADWLQYPDNGLEGRRVRYPGWDIPDLFSPLSVIEPATLTLAIAPDNAYEVVAQTLQRAQHTIHIEAYTFRHPALLDILTEKAHQGITVTLLLEGNPVGLGDITQEWREELTACEAIENAGGTCWFMIHQPEDHIYNRYQYLHAKMIIVDRTWLILGSQNLTPTSLPSDDKANGTLGSRGTVMVIEAPSVAERAEEIFKLDRDTAHQDILRWNTGYPERYGRPPDSTTLRPPTDEISYTIRFPTPQTITGSLGIELYTAPEAALRRTDALAGLLSRAGAGDAIYVEQQYERLMWDAESAAGDNPRILDYINAARRGARVRLLLNAKSFVEGYTGPDEENLSTVQSINAHARAERLNLSASLGDPTGAGIHNKMILIDLNEHGKITHIGSLNGSEAASKVNREVVVQVRDDRVYAYYLALFLSDWYRANPIYLPIMTRSYTAPPPPVNHLVITEVCYTCARNAEWVEIANPGPDTTDLTGYKVGDAETRETYESMLIFPPGITLSPGATLVIAINAVEVPESTLEFYESDPNIPNLIPYSEWGDPTYPFALRNEGDQVLLLGPNDRIIDAVTWGDSRAPVALPHPGVVIVGASLERLPAFQDTDDCATDFRERFPPTPGTLPEHIP